MRGQQAKRWRINDGDEKGGRLSAGCLQRAATVFRTRADGRWLARCRLVWSTYIQIVLHLHRGAGTERTHSGRKVRPGSDCCTQPNGPWTMDGKRADPKLQGAHRIASQRVPTLAVLSHRIPSSGASISQPRGGGWRRPLAH